MLLGKLLHGNSRSGAKHSSTRDLRDWLHVLGGSPSSNIPGGACSAYRGSSCYKPKRLRDSLDDRLLSACFPSRSENILVSTRCSNISNCTH